MLRFATQLSGPPTPPHRGPPPGGPPVPCATSSTSTTALSVRRRWADNVVTISDTLLATLDFPQRRVETKKKKEKEKKETVQYGVHTDKNPVKLPCFFFTLIDFFRAFFEFFQDVFLVLLGIT